MDQKHIRSFFGPTIFARGMALQDDGAVGQITGSVEEGFEAWVDGSSGNEYDVWIALTDEGELEGTDCTCPTKGPCKHAAALALEVLAKGLLHDSAQKKRGREDLPKLMDLVLNQDATVIDLIQGSLPRQETRQRRSLLLAKAQVEQEEALVVMSWKPVIQVHSKSQGLTAGLCLQYIKKDGSPGRIESFSLAKLHDPPAWLVRMALLQEAMKENPRLTILSEELMNAAMEHDLPFIDSKGALLAQGRLDTLTIGTRIQDVNAKGKGNYEVFKVFILAASGTIDGDRTREWPHVTMNSIMVQGTRILALVDGAYLVRSLDSREKRVVSSIMADPEAFLALDDADLEQLWGHDSPWWLRQDREVRELRIVRLHPTPVLEVRDDLYGLRLETWFRYGSKRIQSTEQAGALLLDDGSFLLRDRDFESDMDQVLGALFSETFAGRFHKAGTYGASMFSTGKTTSSALAIGWKAEKFLDVLGLELLDAGIEMWVEGSKVARSREIHIEVAGLGSDWLKVQYQVELENGEFAGIEALSRSAGGLAGALIRSKGQLVHVRKADLEAIKVIQDYALENPGSGQAPGTMVPLSDMQALAHLLEHGHMDQASRKALEQRKVIIERLGRAATRDNPAPPGVPSLFTGSLRPYQAQGYAWLCEHHALGFNCLLADDMGLGKTIQTLCFIAHLMEKGTFGRGLLVSPVVTLSNWIAEAGRFVPSLAMVPYHGATREFDPETLSGPSLILTSYQTLYRDVALLKDHSFDLLILDEAQTVKNHHSKTFDAVRDIQATFKLSLTGTPVENRLMELWAQMHLLEPGVLGTEASFKKLQVNAIEKKNDKNAADRLRRMVQPFILRRRKEEVLTDLPPKEILLEQVDMAPAQRRFYETLRTSLHAEVEAAFAQHDTAQALVIMMAALLRLRQACLLPSLVHQDGQAVPSAKMEFFLQFLDSVLAEDHRILVFSQFVRVIDELRRLCDARHIPWCLVQGDTKDRQAEIDRFKSPDGPRVFFLSLKAGGVGINLVEADYVLLFDPWWNPAVEMQAIDRAHRIGQTRPVTVYKLVCSDSVESRILDLQAKKRDLADSLIAGEGPGPGSISYEEAVALFS